jgi:hypothetical protein
MPKTNGFEEDRKPCRIETLAVAEIVLDNDVQVRPTNPLTVAEYYAAMKNGDVFPPLDVFKEGDTYWLGDGFHRITAAREAGIEAVACMVYDGSKRDAILFACAANDAHGLRRTREDKRRAVTKLLMDEEWRRWSDHEIARQCKVSHTLVADVRSDLKLTGAIASDNSHRRYRTKHGTEAKMAVKRPPEPEPTVAKPPDYPTPVEVEVKVKKSEPYTINVESRVIARACSTYLLFGPNIFAKCWLGFSIKAEFFCFALSPPLVCTLPSASASAQASAAMEARRLGLTNEKRPRRGALVG